jgi:threonine/homoserine/homoserine lactone efflux protein
MPEPARFLIFLGASLALLLAPGPAVLFVITKSVERGRRAGVVASLGLGVGNLIHVIGVVVGISALLVASATAYATLKYLGAAYLIYLGVRRLLERTGPVERSTNESSGLASLFTQGLVVNILNPKVALFFLAFLPQFADPARGSTTFQLGVLGISFVLLGILTDVGYALLAGTAGAWLSRNRVFPSVQRYVTGAVYIGLGVATALAGPGGGRKR